VCACVCYDVTAARGGVRKIVERIERGECFPYSRYAAEQAANVSHYLLSRSFVDEFRTSNRGDRFYGAST